MQICVLRLTIDNRTIINTEKCNIIEKPTHLTTHCPTFFSLFCLSTQLSHPLVLHDKIYPFIQSEAASSDKEHILRDDHGHIGIGFPHHSTKTDS